MTKKKASRPTNPDSPQLTADEAQMLCDGCLLEQR